MTPVTGVRRIGIPSAADDPAAYADALLAVAAGFDTFDVLPRTPVQVRALCADLTQGLTGQPPGPGEWSAALIVSHLFDADVVSAFRWRLVLSGQEPSYPRCDQERWEPLDRLPFWPLLDAWTGLRGANVALLRSASSEAWQYTGRAADQPPETMERMVRTMIGHDIAHLDQLYRTVRAVQAGAGRDVTSLDATYQSFNR